MSLSSNTFSFSIFADDTALVLKLNRESYDSTLSCELTKVMDWFAANALLLNYDKTQFTHFGPHYRKQYDRGDFVLQDLYAVCPHFLISDDYDHLIDDTSIKRVYERGEFSLQDLHSVVPHYLTQEHIETEYGILVEQHEVKYLGVIFDDTLSFKTHINNITLKISKVVGALWKARVLPIHIKLNIYHSLVVSHLNFAILIWGSSIAGNITRGVTGLDHVPSNIKSLNTVHNNAVRAIVCARKRDHLSQIYKDLNLLKLVDLYYYNLAIFAYSTFTDRVPDAFDGYLAANSVPPTHNTRGQLNAVNPSYHYDAPRLKKTLTSIRYASMALWNKLPSDIKNSGSITVFKSRIKPWLADNYVNDDIDS